MRKQDRKWKKNMVRNAREVRKSYRQAKDRGLEYYLWHQAWLKEARQKIQEHLIERAYRGVFNIIGRISKGV